MHIAQCGNSGIFCHSDFTSILENLEVLKVAFLSILGALNFVNLGDFSLQKVKKFVQNQNSEPLNVLFNNGRYCTSTNP